MKKQIISLICIIGFSLGIILCIGPPKINHPAIDPNDINISALLDMISLLPDPNTIIYVDSNDLNNAFPSLDEAVKAAKENYTILVAAGHTETMKGLRFSQEEMDYLLLLAIERDKYPYKSEESNAIQKKIDAILYRDTVVIDKPGLSVIGIGEPKPKFISVETE